SPGELGELEAQERAARVLPPGVCEVVDRLPTTCHPMDVVRTAVSVMGATDTLGEGPEADLARSVRLFAQLPAVVARDQRRRRGLEPVAAREDLGYAE